MSNISTCRVCLLSGNVKFHLIRNTQLQDVFEKLTSFKLNTRDERPERLCSTCCWQLQRFRRFRDKSDKSEGILTQLFHHGIEISQETISILKKKIQHDFLVTPIECMSYNCPKNDMQMAVKEEPNDTYPQTPIIKEEPITTVKEESLEGSALNENEVSQCVTTVCRACLGGQVTSYAIRDTPLQDVYEKLTNTKLSTEHGIPATICFICRAQLKRCRKFMDQLKKSENILTELFRNGIKLTQSTGSILNRRVKINLAKTPVETYVCGENEAVAKLAFVKIPVVKLERLVIKKEPVNHDGAPVGDGARLVYNKNSTKITPEELSTLDVVTGTWKETTPKEKKNWKIIDCEVCGYKCASDCIMAKHKRFHDPKRAYPCDKCNYRFITFPNLRSHKQSVHKMRYKCSKCNKNFTNSRQFKMHLLIHNGEQVYTCAQCNKIFRLRSQLLIHNRAFHPNERYPCEHCSIVCTSSHLLRDHILRFHTGRYPYYICDICDKRFTDKSTLRKHMMGVHTKRTQYICDICKKSFDLKQTLKTHIITHAEIKPYRCSLCPKAFYAKAGLKLHIKNHTGEKPYKCEICNKGCRDKNLLKCHMRTHTGVRHACDLCLKSYANKFHLKLHKLTHTSHVREKLHVCEVCDNTFYDKHALKSHMKRHTKTRAKERLSLPCDICHKILKSNSGLLTHMRAHAGEFPYSCDQCDKSFSYRANFRVHIKGHYGIQVKSHVCDMCPKRFRVKNHLEIHKRSHTGAKPYVCDLCDKTFTHKGSLTCHMRIHTGEKPFACDLCDRTFSEIRSRQLHKIMSHVKTDQYICDLCCRVYAQKEIFIHHVKTHNKKKPYTCYKCKVSFSAMSTLARHMRKHVDIICCMCDKSFKCVTSLRRHYLSVHGGFMALACNRCGKGYIMDELDRLDRHLRVHNGEKPYACKFCGQSFTKGDSMKKHIRRIHIGENKSMG